MCNRSIIPPTVCDELFKTIFPYSERCSFAADAQRMALASEYDGSPIDVTNPGFDGNGLPRHFENWPLLVCNQFERSATMSTRLPLLQESQYEPLELCQRDSMNDSLSKNCGIEMVVL